MDFHEDEYSLLKIYLKEWKAKSSHASPEDERGDVSCEVSEFIMRLQ